MTGYVTLDENQMSQVHHMVQLWIQEAMLTSNVIVTHSEMCDVPSARSNQPNYRAMRIYFKTVMEELANPTMSHVET